MTIGLPCPKCGAELEAEPFGPTCMVWCPRCTPLNCDLASPGLEIIDWDDVAA